MDPRWKHPSTCIVAGPTGCGNTTFVARLLRNSSDLIDPPPKRVTWYYGEWLSAYNNLDIPNLHLEEGLSKSFEAGNATWWCWMISWPKQMVEWPIYSLRRVIIQTHPSYTSFRTFSQKNKESLTISLNVQYMIVFKNPRDASQITKLAKQIYPGRIKFMQEAFNDATTVPYSYLMIDLKQDTPECLRLRTTVLPDDTVQYVYVPKLYLTDTLVSLPSPLVAVASNTSICPSW